MSLQWTAVATFLYAEVFVVLLLCIPFISPPRWQKIFKSRLVQLMVVYGNTFFVVLIVILVLLLIDALREIQKYGVGEQVDLKNNPVAVEHIHMKLFRAQRNLYIAGFSLLLSFLLRRLVTLISKQATLLASNEAFKKQAESASDAAKKYMEENDKLKKQLKAAGVEVSDLPNSNAEDENKKLKGEVSKLKEELESTKKAMLKSDNEVTAIKKQCEGLTKEYDRLLEEHAKLQMDERPSLSVIGTCMCQSHGTEPIAEEKLSIFTLTGGVFDMLAVEHQSLLSGHKALVQDLVSLEELLRRPNKPRGIKGHSAISSRLYLFLWKSKHGIYYAFYASPKPLPDLGGFLINPSEEEPFSPLCISGPVRVAVGAGDAISCQNQVVYGSIQAELHKGAKSYGIDETRSQGRINRSRLAAVNQHSDIQPPSAHSRITKVTLNPRNNRPLWRNFVPTPLEILAIAKVLMK
ncbi:B-cell receptor-associated protein 31 [Pelodytes ibericus]